jgi:predicted DCC family thiol-disulfide oxidoreductase YuxK
MRATLCLHVVPTHYKDNIMSVFEPVHVIYDGQCLFCIRSLKLFRAVDFMHVLDYYDAHDESRISITFPELRDADFDNAMFVVTESRKVSRGFFAFRRMIWSSPLTWLLIPIFYFPGAGFVGTRVYAWIAKNRLKFGCRSDACTLPSLSRKDQL